MNTTKDWDLYIKGKSYNNKLKPNYYAQVDTNIAMASGDQWRNVQANGMPTPVFDIISQGIKFFVASLTSNKTKVVYEPLAYAEDDEGNPMDDQMAGFKEASDIASAEVENLFNKFNMDSRIRDALTDAAITGDVAAHIYFDANKKPYGGAFGDLKGEICFELVDGSSVFFGNANNGDVETQPYIIIQGRDMIKNLQREAKKKQETIVADSDTDNMSGDMGKVEIDNIEGDEYGKATYIIIYKKDLETGTIKVSKCTESVYIYKDIDTELTHYPIAWLRWENQKNQYHGRAVCTRIIPNQIFINRMFAMVMYNLMQTSFPKLVYDKQRVTAPTNEIGVGIGLDNMTPNESIMNAIGYIQPGNMSNQIVQVIDLAIKYTKETLGVNDAMMGNVDPSQASGKSIVATQQAGQIPLEGVNAHKNEWIGDIGKILLDMIGTYYGEREIVVDNKIVPYDFNKLKNLWLNVKTEVGKSSYWSELASVQTIDNLFEKGAIDLIIYLEAMPEGYITNKSDLIDKIKAMQEKKAQEMQMQAQQQQMQQGQAQAQQMAQQQGKQQEEQIQAEAKNQEFEKMASFIESLPPKVQAQLQALPPQVMEQQVMALMKQQVNQSMKQ